MHAQVRTILLVDDSERDVELTLEALRAENLANGVVVACDGADALDYLFRRGKWAEREPGLPSVVLLDIKMPRVDGLEVLRQIRADPVMKALPVVLVTSSKEEPDLREGYRLGTNAYIVKPVVVEDFLRAVGSLGLFWAVLNEPPPVLPEESA